MKLVKLSSEASQELIGTAEFYDQRRIGLGAAFVREFERSLELIQRHPNSGRPMGENYRRVLTNRFPYAVIYIERDVEIFIVAVAHTSRRPGFWRDR